MYLVQGFLPPIPSANHILHFYDFLRLLYLTVGIAAILSVSIGRTKMRDERRAHQFPGAGVGASVPVAAEAEAEELLLAENNEDAVLAAVAVATAFGFITFSMSATTCTAVGRFLGSCSKHRVITIVSGCPIGIWLIKCC